MVPERRLAVYWAVRSRSNPTEEAGENGRSGVSVLDIEHGYPKLERFTIPCVISSRNVFDKFEGWHIIFFF